MLIEISLAHFFLLFHTPHIRTAIRVSLVCFCFICEQRRAGIRAAMRKCSISLESSNEWSQPVSSSKLQLMGKQWILPMMTKSECNYYKISPENNWKEPGKFPDMSWHLVWWICWCFHRPTIVCLKFSYLLRHFSHGNLIARRKIEKETIVKILQGII